MQQEAAIGSTPLARRECARDGAICPSDKRSAPQYRNAVFIIRFARINGIYGRYARIRTLYSPNASAAPEP